MKNFQDEYKRMAVIVGSSVALAYVIYNLVLSFRESGIISKDLLGRKRRKSQNIEGREFVYLLQALNEEGIDKSSLIFILSKLADQAAFTKFQEQIFELGYLPKIANILNYPDQDVKIQAALLLNNLSMNERNQSILRAFIPSLINIIKTSTIEERNVTLFVAVLKTLTNLTALDDSHHHVLPHLSILGELLRECDVAEVKVQTLKIFVNMSTNDKLCENQFEMDAQFLQSVEPFITPDVEEKYLLQAVSCCANVLTSLHRRWQHGKQPCVATPEFVSEKLNENLVRLTTHHIHDVRLQAGRSLLALRAPVREITIESLDEIDILDVLKI